MAMSPTSLTSQRIEMECEKEKGMEREQAVEDKSKSKGRAGKPKTRTGCATCKQRRVKCDETKPECLRCLKIWGHCEGYPTPCYRPRRQREAPRVPKNTLVRPLLPLIKEDDISSASSHSLIPFKPKSNTITRRPSLPWSLSVITFKSQNHHQSFNHFLIHTSSCLPGLFPSSFWSTLLPQSSHNTPFIHSALTALGALSACGRKMHDEQPHSSGIAITPLYRFALSQYGTAVSQMRESLVAGEKGMRDALIACLLVVCFEGLQGNYFQALAHGLSGHSMFRQWIVSRTPSSKRMITEVTGNPAKNVIEDELIHAFNRLDLQILTYVDPRPASVHDEIKVEGSEAVQNMPGNFTSMPQARLYLELIQRRTSHFLASLAAAGAINDHQARTTINTGTEDGTVDYIPESDVMLVLPSALPLSLNAEYVDYANEITLWFEAFNPLFRAQNEGTRNWTLAAILQIQAQTTQVQLLSSISHSLDFFTPTFRSVVETAAKITDDPFFTQPDLFTFDMGIVNPLRLVAKWCREPKIRREAIRLLRKGGCREGLWDALIMAGVSEWMMEIEEEAMDGDGNIKEEERVRTSGVNIDYPKRMAEVSCVKLGTGEERVTYFGW